MWRSAMVVLIVVQTKDGSKHTTAMVNIIIIMGNTCTRGCCFCSVARGESPPPLYPHELHKVATAFAKWRSDVVNRDDLLHQSSQNFYQVTQPLSEKFPYLLVETLTPDFQWNEQLIGTDNIETVEALTSCVRDHLAGSQQSLKYVKKCQNDDDTMFAQNITHVEIGWNRWSSAWYTVGFVFCGCEFGQYLQPTRTFCPSRKT